jgi:hypothetical protein
MFHKKLEVPPILVGSGGSFVGQSKKTVKELSDKYAESTEETEVPEAVASVPAGELNPCSRCRARGTVCDGKKGRACAPCKKAKLSCNFSSTRAPAAKLKGAFSLYGHKRVLLRAFCLYRILIAEFSRLEEASGYECCCICYSDATSDK